MHFYVYEKKYSSIRAQKNQAKNTFLFRTKKNQPKSHFLCTKKILPHTKNSHNPLFFAFSGPSTSSLTAITLTKTIKNGGIRGISSTPLTDHLLVHLRHSQTRLPFSLSTHLLSTFTLPVPKYLTLIATARAKILDVFFLI